MRILMATSAIIALATAGAADAGQRAMTRSGGGGWHGTTSGGSWSRSNTSSHVTARANANAQSWSRANSRVSVRPTGGYQGHQGWKGQGGNRPYWGGRIDGRWWGGQRAPGGWGNYHRPVRGSILPSYWIAPSWYVTNWQGYGLPQAPSGYTWSRYYDDAVLIDGRGSVYDSIGGVDWDRYDGTDVDYSYQDNGYPQGYDGYAYQQQGTYQQQPGYDYGQQGGDYQQQPGTTYAYPQRRDNGVGGAVTGAVVGGVAGNLNRWPGQPVGRHADRCGCRRGGRLCDRQGGGSRPSRAAARAGRIMDNGAGARSAGRGRLWRHDDGSERHTHRHERLLFEWFIISPVPA